MSARTSSRNSIAAMLVAPMFGVASLAASGGAFAACAGLPGNTETKCVKAVQIPGYPLRSYDISWVNPDRAEYYLGDRSNAAIDIVNTRTLTFKRFVGQGLFVGARLNSDGTVNNDISGPDGVVTHGRWLYAGDGDSTLKVFDLDGPNALAQPALNTGGTTRVDEMALTTDGEMLLTVNNAEDPPFANLFAANGDRNHSSVREISKINIDIGADIPAMEQPAWDPKTRRFYVSIPVVGGNPAGCFSRANSHATPPIVVTCDGGLLVIDPDNVTPGSMALGEFDPVKKVGLIKLSKCGPNGSTVGPHDNLMLGCTSANNSFNTATLVINATNHHFVYTGGLVGSDEVWFNKGDGRYYTGTNRQPGGAVLGVVDGETNFLIETIPQSSGSHSVAADSKRNLIFVPQSAPVAVVGSGGDTTAVGAGICGSSNGCVAVYSHHVDGDRDHHDDRDDHGHDHDR
jgi:hypothetical protein